MVKCFNCGQISSENKKYCSDKCKRSAKRKRQSYRAETGTYQGKTLKFKCVDCGKPFYKQNRGPAVNKNFKRCPSCRNRKKQNSLESRRGICFRCRKDFIGHNPRQIYCSFKCSSFASRSPRDIKWVLPIWQPTKCARCSAFYESINGIRKYCSKRCKKKANRDRNGGSTKERCELWGVVYRFVDTFKVFERDNWICHLCGEPVDKNLKGAESPLSPEIDHLIPLSKAAKLGLQDVAHSFDYLRCSHRKCNRFKHNTLPAELAA